MKLWIVSIKLCKYHFYDNKIQFISRLLLLLILNSLLGKNSLTITRWDMNSKYIKKYQGSSAVDIRAVSLCFIHKAGMSNPTRSCWTHFGQIQTCGAAVAEGVEWSSSNMKVRSSIPSLPKNNMHAEVSLSKMLNPELCLIEQQSAANRCTVWMCVWLGECKTVL